MAEPIGALRAELSASAAAFKRDIGAARKAVQAESKKMQKSFRMVQAAGANLTKSIFSMRSAAVLAAGAGGLAALTRKAIATADEIGKTAKSIGATAEELQELRYAAERSGVAQGTFNQSMLAFTKRLGEARQGTGAARRSLDALGISMADIEGKSPVEALELVADRLRDVHDPLERNAILSGLFSRAGIRMGTMLADGAEGMSTLRKRARELGLVISNEMISRAETANDQLDDMADVFKVAGTTLALELMPLMEDLAKIVTSSAFQEGVKDFGENLRTSLSWIVDNKDAIVRVLGAIAGAKLGAATGGAAAGRAGAVWGGLGGGLAGALAGDAALRDGSSGERLPPLNWPLFPPTSPTTDDGSGGGCAPGRPSDAQRVIENLERELDLLGATNEQRQLANALKSASVALNSEQGQQIQALVAQIAEENEAIKSKEKQLQVLESAADSVAFSMEGAFDQFIDGTEINFRDMVNSMLKDLARLMFRLQIIEPLMNSVVGSGGGTGLLGGLFGGIPGFARGGSFRVGGAGGMDSQLAMMRLTPGEMVNISRPGDQSGVNVTVVNNGTPQEVRSQRTTSGGRPGRDITLELDDMNAKNIRRTGSASNMAIQGLGGRPPIVQR